jgi:8-oxo-dGTP pyrophosphatase MutT (NUDIX family)
MSRVGPGVLQATFVPRRFLMSERPGFERQVSAGAVLVRRANAGFDIALIRTKPRPESEVELPASSDERPPPLPPDVEPREGERRSGVDRRHAETDPPGGVERRVAPRRSRRRRSSWETLGRVELPKGKLEPGENALEAALRELREETGLEAPVEVVRELPRVRYAFRTPEGKSVFKTVYYFLILSRDPEPVFTPRGAEGIVAVEWTRLEHALATIAFGNLRPVLEAAREVLTRAPRR